MKLLNQTDLQKKDKTALAARIALLLVFAFGISIILMGTSGLRSYEVSGFSSETAYQAIYSLSEAVEGDWKGDISPLVQSLPPEQQETLEPILYALLTDAWEKQKSGAGEELEALFAETGENNRSALLHKLLYITYQVGGPKVSSSQKKALSAVPERTPRKQCWKAEVI